MVYNDKQRVDFDFGGGVLSWDFFDQEQIDRLEQDPVGTAIGIVARRVEAESRGHTLGGYDGVTLNVACVDSIFIEMPGRQMHAPDQFRYVEGPEMRARIESGNYSAGAYGELTQAQVDQLVESCPRIFSPEKLVVRPLPPPIDLPKTPTPQFDHAANGVVFESPGKRRYIDVSHIVLPGDPPDDYDGPIMVGPVS